jgi:sterol desaturase/sphingolipid hydroxylase (fatty acid hydroxylase superfamily)
MSLFTRNTLVSATFFLLALIWLPRSSHSFFVFAGAAAWCLFFEYGFHRWFQHDPGTPVAQTHHVHHATYQTPADCFSTSCAEHLDFGGHWVYVVILFVGNGAPLLLIDVVFGVRWLAPCMVVFVSYFLFLEIMHRRIHLGQWVPWGAAHHHKHHVAPLTNFGVVSSWLDRLFGTKARS